MQRILQISMTVLVSLAGIIFASAEGAPIASLTVLVALLTLYFVDWQHVFSANTTVAAVLGCLAFLVAGMEFFDGQIESRLLAGGHLILYLTWVFLLQRKTSRHYWWLSALSLLQIAVSSVLTNDLWFGGALVLFTFVAFWTLTVFQLLRATQGEQLTDSQTQQPRLIVGTTKSGISRDVNHGLLNLRFIGTSTFVFCLSLGMAMLFFLFTPRVWIGQYSLYGDSPVNGRPLTGFTEEVRLGDMGEILENNATVARVKVYDHQSGRRFTEDETFAYFGGEPLFRGACQEEYEYGNWSQQRGPRSEMIYTSPEADIRQEITLESIGVSTLFGFGNVLSMESDAQRNPRYNRITSVYSRGREETDSTYQYDVLANPGPFDEANSTERNAWYRSWKDYFHGYLNRLKELPPNLDVLKSLAEEQTNNLDSDIQKANSLLTYLRDSGQFSYSLKLNIEDPSLDPVEDFLVNRKQGHCEYFASAMALMLRAVDIPSRLVTGFKGGFFDEGVLTIQQLHAHSWVEAYIDGQWITFDPTTIDRDSSVSARQGAPSFLQSMKTNITNYWNSGMRLSPSQQQTLLYKPVEDAVTSTSESLKSMWKGDFKDILEVLYNLKSPKYWFSWQGAFVGLFFAGTATALVVVKRLLGIKLLSWRSPRKNKRQYKQVEFYSRLQGILASQGFVQHEAKTAREYVDSAMQSLEPKLQMAGLDQWSGNLIEKFYQVRFGNQPLTDAEADEVDDQLKQLESCLKNGG